VCNNADAKLMQQCKPWAQAHKGYCEKQTFIFGPDEICKTMYDCVESYFVHPGLENRDWTAEPMYCLQQTGYLPEDLSDTQHN
jgi:hypothetical protein